MVIDEFVSHQGGELQVVGCCVSEVLWVVCYVCIYKSIYTSEVTSL